MDQDEKEKARKEGNFCIATGVGVGAVGVASTLTMGVVCPLCYFVPPILIGVGLLHRRKSGAKSDVKTYWHKRT